MDGLRCVDGGSATRGDGLGPQGSESAGAGQRHAVRPPRTLMSYGASQSVGFLIRPMFFSVAGRIRPATNSFEPARAASHLKGRSAIGGGAKRLDSTGAEATFSHYLPTRIPEDPSVWTFRHWLSRAMWRTGRGLV